MNLDKFVEDVVDLGCCHGCGVCLSACPVENCITFEFNSLGIAVPRIDFTKCIGCNSCMTACSGLGRHDHLSRSEDSYGLGRYHSIYEGYSLDRSHRRASSSGGIATEILYYLLKHKLVDCVIVSKMDIIPRVRAYSVVLYSVDQLQLYSKSIYTMVDMSEALKEVIKSKHTFAVVGLPCHIQSITQLLGDKKSRERCKVKIGLMGGKNVCSHALLYEIGGEDLSDYQFRGRGWWEFETRRVHKNRVVYVPWQVAGFSLIWDNFLMMPDRCVICSDFTAEYSDISVCDAWLKKYTNDQDGHSIILTRNQKADNLLRKMKEEDYIYLQDSDENAIYSSQFTQIDYKRRLFPLKVKIYQLLFRKFQYIRIRNISHVNISDWLAMIKHILLNAMSLQLVRYDLYRFLPKNFLKLNRRFVFQTLTAKAIHKFTRLDCFKYKNFKERRFEVRK